MQKQKKEDTSSNYIYDGNDDMGFDDKKSDASGYVDNGKRNRRKYAYFM
jgi:hypothetical protein